MYSRFLEGSYKENITEAGKEMPSQNLSMPFSVAESAQDYDSIDAFSGEVSHRHPLECSFTFDSMQFRLGNSVDSCLDPSGKGRKVSGHDDIYLFLKDYRNCKLVDVEVTGFSLQFIQQRDRILTRVSIRHLCAFDYLSDETISSLDVCVSSIPHIFVSSSSTDELGSVAYFESVQWLGKSRFSQENGLHLKLEILNVEWNPNTVAACVRFFSHDLDSKLKSSQGPQAMYPTGKSPTVRKEDSSRLDAKHPSELALQCVRISVSSLNLSLNRDAQRKLVNFGVREVELSYWSYSGGAMAISGSLGNLTATDICSEVTNYREFMGLHEDQVFLLFYYA
jgi:hypothetical protein